MGLQWQWQANPQPYWWYMTGSALRLYSFPAPDSAKNLWDVPNVLSQKFPAENFTATVKINFLSRLDGERMGLVIMGTGYADISLVKKKEGVTINFGVCKEADKGRSEVQSYITTATASTIYFRVSISTGANCQFSYSLDGEHFTEAGEKFKATPGRWIGATMGLFCTRETKTNDAGWGEVDWFRVEK
jgi:hypothetical protein